MQAFVDEACIDITSGNGGSGSVSFRREKYVPYGGPDGGDGGRGGDVLFIVKKNLKTLSHLKMKPHFKAQNGEPGKGKRKHGSDGKDAVIPVPPGTIVRDLKTGETLKDFTAEEGSWTALHGGRGGRGNWHFRTSVNQAPRYAQEGLPGKTLQLFVELDIIADIGFVGFPNAGKSTLLSVLTNAKPKIGNYPFTTKIPNLGVIHSEERDIILADIPGLIEGASEGAGLGIKFLKHISRTKFLVFLIDLTEDDFSEKFEQLLHELKTFSQSLPEKDRIIVGTKLDMPESENNLRLLEEQYPGETVIGISALAYRGIGELKKLLVYKSRLEGS